MEGDQALDQYGQQPTPPSSAGDPEKEEKRADEPTGFAAQLPKTGLNNGSGSGSSNSFFGKHRMAAAISNLENQIKLFQEELDQLDTLGESSAVCEEIISSIESTSDPLLPETKGPIDLGWDKWFRGVQNSRRRWP